MLHRHSPRILERAKSLPHNHSAVLRFGTNKVAEVLGIPFKRVTVVKTTVPWRNPVADAMAYSWKVLGEHRSDRSVLLPERWTSTERWIAPPNLIEQMAEGVDISYDVSYDFPADKPKVISTIPMPSLAKAMGYRDLGWKWIDGKNIVATLRNCEAYVSVMAPNPSVPFTRASITGDQLIIELSRTGEVRDPDDVLNKACQMLGVLQTVSSYEIVDQHYAKIAPINEEDRRNFIYHASTETGRAYQLGRFATWRPRLLADDLVQDVRIIEGWINSGSSTYDQQLHERRTTA
jgi:hypothetical protein